MPTRSKGYGRGSTFQRGKRWWIQYPNPVKGEKKVREGSWKSEKEAREALEARLAEIIRSRQGKEAMVLPTSRTFQDAVDLQLIEWKRKGIKSVYNYSGLLGTASKLLGKLKVTSITTEAVWQYIEKRREAGVKNITVKTEIDLVFKVLRLCKELKWLAELPKKPDILKPGEGRKKNQISAEEFKRLIASIEDEDFRDCLLWLYLTGCRTNEVTFLTWSSFRRNPNGEAFILISASETKEGFDRVFPVAGVLADIMKRRIARRNLGSEFIFQSEGRPFHSTFSKRRECLSKMWRDRFRDAVKASGVSCTPHDFRRSAYRNMRNLGIPSTDVRSFTGHKTDQMELWYSVECMADQIQAQAKLAQLWHSLESKPA